MSIDAAALIDNVAVVDFGRLDAEQDEKLLEYFIDTGSVQEVRQGKYLIVGRKGSGKTSIFAHLAGTLDGRIVEMDLDKYVFKAHKMMEDGGVQPPFAYTESWRAAITVAMFVEVAPDIAWLQRHKGIKILRKLGAGPNAGPLGAIVDWLSRVRNIKLPSVTGIFDLGQLELDSLTPKQIENSTSHLIDDLEKLIEPMIRRDRITVLIDRLDDAWDGTADSLRIISGAVRAARDFAMKYRPDLRTVPPVVVFLRSDLWDKCRFNDKNKIPPDTVELAWSDDELADVIDLRIHKSTSIDNRHGWDELFTTDRMRQGVTVRSYILKRTLGRPRDIVAFAIYAAQVSKSHGNRVIEKADVYEAEALYSAHVTRELADELTEHVKDKNFDTVLSVLRALKVRNFTPSKWVTESSLLGFTSSEATTNLTLLFESGVVGMLQSGGAGGGRSTVYHFQEPLLKIDGDKSLLQIHPAFTKELGLTEKYATSLKG